MKKNNKYHHNLYKRNEYKIIIYVVSQFSIYSIEKNLTNRQKILLVYVILACLFGVTQKKDE